jgi:beta-glucosidase-like glycosyl hydrolase
MSEQLSEGPAPHLVVGLEGPELTAGERDLLAQVPPAGVILFDRNVTDTGQLRRLTADVDRIVRYASGLSPLVMADHEGGRISALFSAIGTPPTQMAIGRAGDSVLCREVFRETARRLRYCGVNTLLAPVADINSEYLNPVIGMRAFGEERDIVSRFVGEAVTALREGGVVSCLKHFPGHGSSRTDSHRTLPQLPFTLEQLAARDMEPFGRGIEAGSETVMVGHVTPLDRRLPSSLDPTVISVLRRDLGFDGVVMTDALEMAGVQVYSIEGGGPERLHVRPLSEIVTCALAAGNDLLVFSRPICEVIGRLKSLTRSTDEYWKEWSSGARAASLRRIRRLRAGIGFHWSADHRNASKGAATPGKQLATPDEPLSQPEKRPAPPEERRVTPEIEFRRDPEIYRSVAFRAVRFIGERPPVTGAQRYNLSFAGEREDLASVIVARFVKDLALKLGISERVESPRGDGRRVPFPGTFLRRVVRCRASGTEEPMEVEVHGCGDASPQARSIMVFLNRRPLPRDVCTELSAGANLVVVAGWPYAVQFVPPGTPAIGTYGVYDAAVDVTSAMITVEPGGHGKKGPGKTD